MNPATREQITELLGGPNAVHVSVQQHQMLHIMARRKHPMTQAAIATALSTSPGSVRVQIQNVRERLWVRGFDITRARPGGYLLVKTEAE